MSTKIVKVTEPLPDGSSGGFIRDRIGQSIGSARRRVFREKGLILSQHTTKVFIVIEQEYDDGK